MGLCCYKRGLLLEMVAMPMEMRSRGEEQRKAAVMWSRSGRPLEAVVCEERGRRRGQRWAAD